jgi:hypothetical protein
MPVHDRILSVTGISSPDYPDRCAMTFSHLSSAERRRRLTVLVSLALDEPLKCIRLAWTWPSWRKTPCATWAPLSTVQGHGTVSRRTVTIEAMEAAHSTLLSWVIYLLEVAVCPTDQSVAAQQIWRQNTMSMSRPTSLIRVPLNYVLYHGRRYHVY